MNKQKFSVDFGNVKLIGDAICQNNQPDLLFLHGGGALGKIRFDRLRDVLSNKKIGSCAFDFIGHGETTGNIAASSLESRAKQTLAVIESQKLLQPLSVVASSMSGHIAIKLTKFLNIANLILIAPAIYTSKAYAVSFGPMFSEIIRAPYSWRDSDVWEILKDYKGSLLIFAAGKDQVIPDEVIKRIYNSAASANSKEIITFKNATHPLIEWLNERPNHLEQVSDKIYNAVQKQLKI